jgi:hypothetical protein
MEMDFLQAAESAFFSGETFAMKKTKTKIKKTARVVIDDDSLVDEAVRLGGHRTKREAVERALEEFTLWRKRRS